MTKKKNLNPGASPILAGLLAAGTLMAPPLQGFVPRLYTDWKQGQRPPVRGVWAVLDPRPGFARFDGAVWYGVEDTVIAATYNMNVSDVQNRIWCGLTEEAHNMLNAEPFFPPFCELDTGKIVLDVIAVPEEVMMDIETMSNPHGLSFKPW